MEVKNAKLLQGDCLERLKALPDAALDSLVTDPPAGISFMGKDWDGDKGGRDEWVAWMRDVMRECYRVLKPGAHGLVWALPRTSHWTATALEDAGFEVRDVVTHLFGTGFPKSMDISKAIDKAAGAEREVIAEVPHTSGIQRNHSLQRAEWDGNETSKQGRLKDEMMKITAPATDAAKQWQGWGTALKPASEHWILVRKPCSEKTVAANVLKHATGGLNIDGCRVATSDDTGRPGTRSSGGLLNVAQGGCTRISETHAQGRFPANLVLDEEAAKALDEQSGLNCGAAAPVRKKATPGTTNTDNYKPHTSVGDDGKSFRGDTGGASRFFYVAKASKSDKGADNTHPTVKSTALMRYLIRLVTPSGGLVLDPFMGSGSTGVAAIKEGMRFVGVEREAAYFAIAKGRIGHAIEEGREDEPTAVSGAV